MLLGWRIRHGPWHSHYDLRPCTPPHYCASTSLLSAHRHPIPQVRVSNISFTGSGDQGVLLCPTSPATFLTGPKSPASVFCGAPVLGHYVAVRLLDPKSDITSNYSSVSLCGVDVWALVRSPKGACAAYHNTSRDKHLMRAHASVAVRAHGACLVRLTACARKSVASLNVLCTPVCHAA